MKNKSVIAIILSGGGGERMAGLDKGLQLYRGRPLIEHVIEVIANQVDQLIISVNRNKSEYEKLERTLVTDRVTLYQGPLAGIRAGINYIKQQTDCDNYQYLLVSSCDTPNLPVDFVTRLESVLTKSEELVAVVNDGEQNQNLHCLIHRDAWQSIRDYYTGGGRAMHRWLKQIGAMEVDFSDRPDAFININTLQQLVND